MSRSTSFTDEMEAKANEYINGGYLSEDQVIPSVVGMALSLNVSKSTLYKWAEDKHGTISDTLARCNDKQHMILLSKGLTSEFSGTIVKLALSNHGYSEKTSTDITSGGEKIQNNYNIYPVSNDKA
jgi:hypothetical protein